jgi:hypothetical protein
VVSEGPGRNRKYCRRSCRQRAYESRQALAGTSLPADTVILTAQEAENLAERMYLMRCAAEDLTTAVAEGDGPAELGELCRVLLAAARDAERLR